MARFLRDQLSDRYAKAFLHILDPSVYEAVYRDVQYFLMCCRDVEGLSHFLEDPSVGKKEKKKAIALLKKEGWAGNLMHFWALVIDHKRSAFLRPILQAFVVHYQRKINEGRVKVELAHPILSKELENELLSFVKGITGWKSVTLEVVIKPTLLGGYRLFFDQKKLDGSLKGHLDQIEKIWQKKLQETLFTKKIISNEF